MLLGFALGCLGIYAYETVEARRFQAEQAAAFERAASAAAPGRVRAGRSGRHARRAAIAVVDPGDRGR